MQNAYNLPILKPSEKQLQSHKNTRFHAGRYGNLYLLRWQSAAQSNHPSER